MVYTAVSTPSIGASWLAGRYFSILLWASALRGPLWPTAQKGTGSSHSRKCLISRALLWEVPSHFPRGKHVYEGVHSTRKTVQKCSVVVFQSLSYACLFMTPWTAAHRISLSFTVSQSLLKFVSIESVMLANHLILGLPPLLLPSIFPSIRAFSSEIFWKIINLCYLSHTVILRIPRKQRGKL